MMVSKAKKTNTKSRRQIQEDESDEEKEVVAPLKVAAADQKNLRRTTAMR